MSITVNDIFVFTAILLFGAEVAATISVIEGFLSSFRVKVKKLYKQLFNLAELTLVTFTVGKLFYYLEGKSAPLDPNQVGGISTLLVNLAFCALVYFLLNSGAVALAIALFTNQSVRRLWKQNFLWASVTNFAGASAAAVIFLYFKEIQFYSITLAVPVVVVIYYAYNITLHHIKQTQRHLDQMNELYHSTIASLAMAIDAKDQCTHGHVQRVQKLALGLARYCNLTDENQLQGLRAAALLHDIGKLAIPEYILNKPSQLTKSEFEKMKVHPAVGADILDSVPFPYPVVPFVRYHHEKWDGTGYPEGLKGEQIPLGARILAIADCYDALRSDRPYRPKLSRQVALEFIKKESAKAYDPMLVDQLVQHIDELEEELEATAMNLSQSIMQRIEASLRSMDVEEPKRIQKTVFHDIASMHKEIPAIYEFSRTVGKSLNVSETLALLATKIKNLVPFTSCAVYLLSSQNDKIVAYHTSGVYSELLDSVELDMGQGVTGWVAANNKTLMNVSPTPDFTHIKLLQTEFKSCLAVPLALDNNVVGVITLYSTTANVYHYDHLRIMETISNHAAAAIKNALIYEETQEDAYTDLLTGLPNSRYFNTFISQELKRAERINYPVSLLMMDLESFKEVNDTYGHQVGDRVLIQVAHILRNQMRKSDTCVRYGGDEFIGVLPGVNKTLAQQTISRIQSAVDTHRMTIDDTNAIQIGISIGAATFPADGEELSVLMAAADQAMYRDKLTRTQRKRRSGSVVAFEKHADPA
ncbi:MAG: diguanylate cyclase [Acidobacteria bacterium]|nr:diguanylate cyclase [Acidobacteriota bacterium]